MPETARIAVYTRKSKYSDKSESIDSQIEYCKQAAKARYTGETEFSVYVDEGFSGGTAERPEYKRLLADLHYTKYAAVICYKIDRLSRSLADFTSLQQELESHGVNIISASEGFDTSTAWGQAVLNILMIFAQLERKNVSERVRDTMLHYGRQGRWTGGVSPTGFTSGYCAYTDAFGREKKMSMLIPVSDELETVALIFGKYAELGSLNAVATFLANEGVKTKNGNYFTSATVRDILSNPVYAAADINVYRYFSQNGAEITSTEADFDGTRSVLAYNREDKRKVTARPMNEWVIALGRHEGLIEGCEWVRIQHLLAANADKKPRLGTARYGIFSGLITCARCGAAMRVKKGRLHDGKTEFYYICRTKESSRRRECDIPNIAGHSVEPAILEEIRSLAESSALFDNMSYDSLFHESENASAIGQLERGIEKKRREIAALLNLLAAADEGGAKKHLLKRIDELDAEITSISKKITALKAEENRLPEAVCRGLRDSFVDTVDIAVSRRLMGILINKIEWNGSTLFVTFNSNA